jgi:hypothetical protein
VYVPLGGRINMPPELVGVIVLLVGSLAALLLGALFGALAGPPADGSLRPRWGGFRIAAVILTWMGAAGIIAPMLPVFLVIMQPQVWSSGLGCCFTPPVFLALSLGIVQSVLIRRASSRSLAYMCIIELLSALPGGGLVLSTGAAAWGQPTAAFMLPIAVIGPLIGGVLCGVRAIVHQKD